MEIDVVAVDERSAIAAVGSCKWTTDPMDVSEYAALQKDLARSGLGSGDPFLFLFSRSGFTERLREIAEMQQSPRLILVGLTDLYAV